MLNRRYAKALLEAAEKAAAVEKIGGQFEDFIGLLGSSPDMQKIIGSPTISPLSRKKVLERITEKSGYHKIFNNFLIILNEKGRIKNLPGIHKAFLELINESKGIVTARLSYAGKMNDSELKKIKSALEKISGKEIVLDVEIDPQLIGGIKVEMAGTVYDGSLKNRIKMLRDQLTGE